MVARKTDAGSGLNARLGNTIKGKRASRVKQELRHVVMGLLLVAAISVAIFLLFIPA